MARASRIVVVGSGSAGGVVAARLSENPENSVLLLEAGANYRSDTDLPQELRDPDMPVLVGPHDWGFRAFLVEPADSRDPIDYPRGKVIGGSSAVNGSVAQRGNAEDYDEWAASGNPGWSFQDVLPAFNRLESDREFGAEPYHGTEGPVDVIRYGRDEWAAPVRAWEETCIRRGFESAPDLNAPGVVGVGPMPRNVSGGFRASSARSHLRRAANRANLSVRGDALVRRVLFEGTRAMGVELAGPESEQIEADIVILAGGAINTPQILTLSGIAADEDLSRLGITPVLDLPGVGRNLQDHPIAPIMGLLKSARPEDFNGFRGLLKYRSGGSAVPDLLIFPGMIARDSLPPAMAGFDAPGVLMLGAVVGKPRSRGFLKILSADPTLAPEIHINFLADDQDFFLLKEVAGLAYELIDSEPLSDHITDTVFIDSEIVADEEAFSQWVRAMVSTGYHCVGTCAMGPAAEEGAVVDARLRVHGTEGLYVADASIMPQITSGLTNLPAYMIGERAVDFIEAEDSSTSRPGAPPS